MTFKDEIPLPPRFPDGMPSIQLGEIDPALTLTPPASFPKDTTAEQRAAMRFGVSGNAVCTAFSSPDPEITDVMLTGQSPAAHLGG